MKRLLAGLTLTLILVLTYPATSEQILYHRFDSRWYAGIDSFQQANPKIRLEIDDIQYDDWNRMSSFLITGQVKSDVFELETFTDDCSQIFAKGYCLDLSNSEELPRLVSRLHPSIQAQVMHKGTIYAFPLKIYFSTYEIDRRSWTAAGLDTKDIPQSFPSLLDFLGNWCLRQEQGEDLNIRVKNNWVPELYTPGSYIAWLTNELIKNHMMQQEYAGESLRFQTPEMLALLRRIQEVGARIYAVEPSFDPLATGEGMGLFPSSSSFWPKDRLDLYFLPINENQPQLIQASLQIVVVNARTQLPKQSAELVEYLAQGIPDTLSVFLYQDAEPVIDPNFERNNTITLGNIAKTKEALKNPQLSMSEKQDLENKLRKFQLMYEEEQTDQYKYVMSPAQLTDYKPMTAHFVFIKPGYFSFGKDSYFLSQTIDRFAAGQLSAEGLLQELDRVVMMMEKEAVK